MSVTSVVVTLYGGDHVSPGARVGRPDGGSMLLADILARIAEGFCPFHRTRLQAGEHDGHRSAGWCDACSSATGRSVGFRVAAEARR